MRLIATAAALMAGACLLLVSGTTQAMPQDEPDPIADAMELMRTDPTAALAILEASAAEGDVNGINAVAVIIDNPPPGIPEDRARALRLWEQAVAQGSEAARLNLGSRLLVNDDPSDDARAVRMLEEVRDERLTPFASYPLGRAYLFGDGVERDITRGGVLMRAAVQASPDNIDAQYLLGRAYQNGWGIPADPAAAVRHLRIAADAGLPQAQWHMGMHLLNGDGIAADPALARAYVAQSAEGGSVDGMVSMAVMLALGEGGPVNAAEARVWYQRAAAQGSAHALRGLGAMLVTGEGGPVDVATGAAYLDLAAKAGEEMAPRLQQMFRARIEAVDVAEIEAAKSRWLLQHGLPDRVG